MSEGSAFEQIVIDTLKQHTNALGEVKDEIVAVGAVAQQTLGQATKTNGRVDSLEEWRAGIDMWRRGLADGELAAAAFEEGAESVRQGWRRRVTAAWSRVERPVMYGLGLLLFGLGIRVGAWFVGGPW